MAWIIAGIIVVSIGGLVATIVISVKHDVASGYIPREERRPASLSGSEAPDAVTPGG
jgi:hypothetical protein